jgi:Ca-activated chloride channel family protein
MPDFSDNHYARLGVSRTASLEEIRIAYHEAARRYHPDVNPDPESKDTFLSVQKAYDILSTSESRKDYDNSLPGETSNSLVTLNARFSRSTLARVNEPQLIYALLEVIAVPGADTTTIPPLNICLVLDRSTSMKGLRLDTLKSTARELVRQLRSQDYLSIIAFSDLAEVLVPATRGSDYGKIEARISLLQSGGSTEIYKGLKAGYFEVSRNLSPSYINHMILITDGRTYGDEAACLELANQARTKGVTISGLGIGTEWNDDFLDEIASKTGGSSQYVTSAEDIRHFLEEKFIGLGKVFAESLQLDYEQDSGVELKYAFRLEPEAGPLSLEKPIILGDVPRESSLSILMEFLVTAVPEESEKVQLAQGQMKMDVPTQIVPTSRVPFALTRPTSETIDPEPPPQKIVRALSKLTLYRMQEQARRDMENGDVEQATRRLQNLATHLLSQGERQLARTVLAEADRVEQGQALSEQGEKRIKYGTRALLLPQHLEEALS